METGTVRAAAATQASTPPRALLVAAFAAIYGIWGSTYLAIAVAVETLPPLLMVGVRFLAAGSVLMAWALLRGEAWPRRDAWLAATVQGLFVLGAYALVAWAEQRVASGASAVLAATSPLFVVLLDAQVRGRLTVMMGVVVGLVGVLLLASPWRSGSGVDPWGSLAILVSALLWGAGAARAKKAPVPGSALMGTAMELLTGSVVLLSLALVSGEPGVARAVDGRSLLAMAYLVVFGSVVAYTAFHWLLQVSSPSLVSTHAYVNPVIALGLGWTLHGEVVGGATVAAATLVLASVWMLAWATRRARETRGRQPCS